MAAVAIVDCAGVFKSYGSSLILRGVDFRVGAGEVFGLLGPNGAGKTTTMRIILGLVRPDAGQVTVLDRPAGHAELAGRVGAMVEEPPAYGWLTGRDQLLTIARSGRPVTRRQVDQALARVRMVHAADKKVRTYSQGMRQRLGLAAALLRQPPLVVLDEPTNGLDPVGIVEFRRIMTDLTADGTTVLLSSHLLAEVQNVCTRVALLVRGRVVRCGTVAEVAGPVEAVSVQVVPADADRAATALAAWPAQPTGEPGHLQVPGSDVPAVARALQDGGVVPCRSPRCGRAWKNCSCR